MMAFVVVVDALCSHSRSFAHSGGAPAADTTVVAHSAFRERRAYLDSESPASFRLRFQSNTCTSNASMITGLGPHRLDPTPVQVPEDDDMFSGLFFVVFLRRAFAPRDSFPIQYIVGWPTKY